MNRAKTASFISIAAIILAIFYAPPANAALDDIPKNRAKQIENAAPAKPRVKPAKPRRVLVWCTPPHLMPTDPHKSYCIPYGAYAMKTLGIKTGAFEPVISDDLTLFAPDKLKQFDALIFNNASRAWITPTDEVAAKLKALGADKEAVKQALQKSLLDYVNNGGGIAAYHYAMGGNPKWPEFKELMGAGMWGHPWNEEVGIKIDDAKHPLTAAFAGQPFRLHEEIFQFNEPYSRTKLRVLISLDVEHTNMGVQWIHRKDNDFALAWVKPYGKGRVFYTAIGHRAEHYWNPTLLQFYLDGIQFATGDLKAPMAPSAPPAKAAK